MDRVANEVFGLQYTPSFSFLEAKVSERSCRVNLTVFERWRGPKRYNTFNAVLGAFSALTSTKDCRYREYLD